MSQPATFELRPLPDGRTGKGDRFWTRVDRTPGHGPKGECWLWTGSRKTNTYRDREYFYGQLGFVWPDGSKHPIGAHVCSFYLTRGRFPEKGMMVCHSCDNPPCVRPDHLWEGTAKENGDDARKKGRMQVAAPKKARDTRVRLTLRQLGKIARARKGKGLNIYDAGGVMGLSYSRYSRLESGDEPTCTFAELETLAVTLRIQLEDLRLRDTQFYLWGYPISRIGNKGRVTPYLKAYSDRPHKFWSKLSPPTLNLYRADLIRAAMIQSGARIVKTFQAAGISRDKFLLILAGECQDFDAVATIARRVGIPESAVFNVKRAEAA